MDAAKKYRLDVMREILKCKRNAYNLQWCTKGKQNFILEGVTVILIITCDTKKGRKEGRKETNSGVKNDERGVFSSSFFRRRARTISRTRRDFAACVPVQ